MTHPKSTFIKPPLSSPSPSVRVRNRTGDEAGTGNDPGNEVLACL